MTILTSLKVVLISSKKVREQMSEEDLRFTTRAILTQIKIQDLDVPDVQPGFRKEKPEIKLPTSAGSFKKQESSIKTSTSASLTMPKPLTVDHIKLWKILTEIGILDHLTGEIDIQVKKPTVN